MAITGVDGIAAGMQQPEEISKSGAATVAGRFYSPFYVSGRPAAAVAPSPGIAGAALTSYAGQIPFTNPGSGNSYLAGFSGSCNVVGTLLLCDRLWHNSGVNVTIATAQTVNSVAWPARDRTGTTNGEGVRIGVEVSTVMGAGTPTFSYGYTNSAGTASRTFTSGAQATTMAVGSFIPLDMQAGDTGVRSIQNFTLSATMTSGAFHLVAYRILARGVVNLAGGGFDLDWFGCKFPRLYDNTVPFLLWLPSTTTAPSISALMSVAQG